MMLVTVFALKQFGYLRHCMNNRGYTVYIFEVSIIKNFIYLSYDVVDILSYNAKDINLLLDYVVGRKQ